MSIEMFKEKLLILVENVYVWTPLPRYRDMATTNTEVRHFERCFKL